MAYHGNLVDQSGERTRRSRGISLTELMVVAAIAIIMLGMAVPIMSDNDTAGPEVRRLVADLVRTRSLARTTWETTSVQTDAVAERWRCQRADGSTIDGPGANSEGWRTLGIGVEFEEVLGTTHTFTFLPNGRAQEPAVVRLRADGALWEIALDSLSGRIAAAPVAGGVSQ